MSEPADPTDADVVADLTGELPLSRYCVIGGELRLWHRLKRPEGDVWLPLGLLIDDDAVARVAAGAMCRAGVRTFRSVKEAVAWTLTQTWPP